MKVASFFAGCGGLDLGFRQAGFDVIWANELDSSVRATYHRNHPHTELVIDDILNIDPAMVPECDGFIGGPPCQSWSVAGRQRGLDDRRGQLFLTYIQLIKAIKPKFFLIENVKGLLDNKFKVVFEDFLSQLDEAGYEVQWKLLNAVDYNIPQTRERVFIIGFRKELEVRYEWPRPVSLIPISLKSAIGDLSDPPYRYDKNEIPVLNLLRPNHDVYTGPLGWHYKRGNRRRGWENPSFTIHATGENIPLHPSSPKMIFLSHENWDFNHTEMSAYRRLSVRECARIQTFPDKFIFEGATILQQYKMIGNAVPPRLARILANSIRKVLGDKEICCTLQYQDKKEGENAEILIGYYKNPAHCDLILKHKLYYVRYDERPGSFSSCTSELAKVPEYLLLHHKEEWEIHRLEKALPQVVSASYLQSLGFKAKGKRYLCFRLESDDKEDWEEISRKAEPPGVDSTIYSPLIVKLNNL